MSIARGRIGWVLLAGALSASLSVAPMAQMTPSEIVKGDFRFSYDERGISLVSNPNDPFGATLTTAGGGRGGGRNGAAPAGPATLALTVSYRAGSTGEWTSLARGTQWTPAPDAGRVTYVRGGTPAPLKVT
jgi:hypothetical protein